MASKRMHSGQDPNDYLYMDSYGDRLNACYDKLLKAKKTQERLSIRCAGDWINPSIYSI